MSGKLYGVALGPGDPDLISVKGLKALQKSDIIYYPGSKSANGTKSFSMAIMESYQLEGKTFKGVFLPMSLDRNQAQEIYNTSFNELLGDYASGKTISFVAEGDISFYSTFAYLIDQIHEAKLDFEMIPGIPAFILAGALSQTPLALQSDSLCVLSQCSSAAKLSEACSRHATVVLMKPTTMKNQMAEFLNSYHGSIIYGEKLGTEDQYLSTDIEEIGKKNIPYFSILILKQ